MRAAYDSGRLEFRSLVSRVLRGRVPGDVQACLVEIDMGTLTLRRFARKMQAFECALEDEVFRRHFKHAEFKVLVLVLTQSKRRLESLRQVAGRVVPNDRHGDYYLATFGALTPTAFAAAEWRDLDGQTYPGVLYGASRQEKQRNAALDQPDAAQQLPLWEAEPSTAHQEAARPKPRTVTPDGESCAAALGEVAVILGRLRASCPKANRHWAACHPAR